MYIFKVCSKFEHARHKIVKQCKISTLGQQHQSKRKINIDIYTTGQPNTCFKNPTLTQGMFVGAVSDNFDERIDQKIFHSEIVVDNENVAAETKAYKKIPEILSFIDKNGEDKMKTEIEANYR